MMPKSHRRISICFRSAIPVLFLFVLSCTGGNSPEPGTLYDIRIGDRTARLEVGVDKHQRRKGLMYHNKLAENQGMLLVYPRPLYRMHVANRNLYDLDLDVAFVDSKGKIINFETLVGGENNVAVSSEPAQFAIQMKGNWFDENKIKPGARVKIPKRFLKKADSIATYSGLKKISVDGVDIQVEIANSPNERARGLMERRSIPENSGMLFVYPEPQSVSYYMKNTLIPLDIAYVKESGEILAIHQGKPLDETSFPSKEPVQYVLEMRKGWFQEQGLGPGDHVMVPESVIQQAK